MATEGGGSDSPVDFSEVEELLRSAPYRFEFFQAIRLLERIAPDRKPLGRFTNPSDEVARLGAHPSLSFPASEIQSIDWPEGKAPISCREFHGDHRSTGSSAAFLHDSHSFPPALRR